MNMPNRQTLNIGRPEQIKMSEVLIDIPQGRG